MTTARSAREKRLDAALRRAIRALVFYADPGSYHAIGLLPDRPCGRFADDTSYVEEYGRRMHGREARKALERMNKIVNAEGAPR